MDGLRCWVGMLRGVGPWNVLTVGLVRSLLNVLFLSVHHTIPYEWVETQRQTNASAITVDGQKPVLDNSIEKDQNA